MEIGVLASISRHINFGSSCCWCLQISRSFAFHSYNLYVVTDKTENAKKSSAYEK